jgi:hypothetical protein
MSMHAQQPPAYQAEHELSERTGTWLSLIPGLGCIYAGKEAAAAGWFVSVAFVEVLVVLLAFPKGRLTGFGYAVIGFLEMVAFIIWGAPGP